MCAALFAPQTAPAARSWYVSREGKDDNNGRSPEQAFSSLNKAFSSAAASNVKTIIIIGTVRSGLSTPSQGTGAGEIFLTGLTFEDPALAKAAADYVKARTDYEKAVREYPQVKRQAEQAVSSYEWQTANAKRLLESRQGELNGVRQELAELETILAKAEAERARLLKNTEVQKLRDQLAAERAKIDRAESDAKAKAEGQKNQARREKALADAEADAAKARAGLAPLEAKLQAEETKAAKTVNRPLREAEDMIRRVSRTIETRKETESRYVENVSQAQAALDSLSTPPSIPPEPAAPIPPVGLPENYAPARIAGYEGVGLNISGASTIRLENIVVENSLSVNKSAVVSVGKNVVLGGLSIGGTVTMETNAEVKARLT